MSIKEKPGMPQQACGLYNKAPQRRCLCFWGVIVGFLTILLESSHAEAYIGPGAGFAVLGSFFALFAAMAAGVLAVFTWPIRWLVRVLRNRKALGRSRIRKFVVLGLDGMDPELTEKYMAAGKLPNLSKLSNEGCFKKLATTVPPISPVAWSSFQTGSNPGKHRIFDFLTRDKRTYFPTLSSVSVRGSSRTINIGKYSIPLGKADVRLLRKGKPFWHYLGDQGVFSTIIRVPISFPPEKFRGLQLSGMCVPDLRGSQGTFSFYSTRPVQEGEYTGGERFLLELKDGVLRGVLLGPENPIRRDRKVLSLPFDIPVNGSRSDAYFLRINGEVHHLKKGEYTDWIPVTFKAGLGVKVRGICQFLLLNTKPEIELYVTPINIDPEKPAMPIAHPPVYSTYLSKLQNRYATLGLAEDTWALNEMILNDDAFLHQCLQGDLERERMFFDALDKVKRGLVVCVFDGTDRIQHTFWRYLDKGHPASKCEDDHRGIVIEKLYERMDKLVGRTLERCRAKDTALMVISDHGFKTFRYGVDLNRWLVENSYLELKENHRDKKYLGAVDWSLTRAYAMGLSGIFLNIKGREAQGIVDRGDEADRLRREIADKLTALRDPMRDKAVVRQVYNAMEVYKGPYRNEAPDLIVGYEVGYRASWETAVGQVTDGIFHDNTKAWSGDHCIDRDHVPGVLFSNRPIETNDPRLIDIGPTVLEMFGVDVPKNMDGRALKVAEAN